ncbi:hypothetical protein KKF84_05250, partial [Myxococcota bacterium]|nr:hypothetical protein [Myxococcota bacterium]
QHLMWMDHKETNFQAFTTEGDFCDYASGGDCELRGTGPTPLADSLYAVKAYMDKVVAEDIIAGCRKYAVILLTDGVETCRGNPAAAATELLNNSALETYVIGFSVLPTEQASLNAIANAGSVSGTRNAFFVGNEDELAAALAGIVAQSVVFESCNDIDDDCDGLVDEDFPSKGLPCDDGGIGPCRGTGNYQCRADFTGVECVITTAGATAITEICDGIDNNCNGQVDEGLNCQTECVPSGPEVCDGIDNNCNGAIDEDDPLLNLPCGEGEGVCEPGVWICAGGTMVCLGGVEASDEMCNGLDDDCDGAIDNDAPCPPSYWCIEGGCRIACADGEFPCGGGAVCTEYVLTDETVNVCMPTACSACEPGEICVNDQCVDPCENVECEENETCVLGVCRDCHSLGCQGGLICYDGECVEDPCGAVSCDQGEYCAGGTCVPLCYDELCPSGKLCNEQGECVVDPCADAECESTEYCSDGTCLTNPCPSVYCEPGKVCIPPGECVADPCDLIVCPLQSACQVDVAGSGRCVSDSLPIRPEEITGMGGNGCSCDAGQGNPEPSLLLLLMALVSLLVIRKGGVA